MHDTKIIAIERVLHRKTALIISMVQSDENKAVMKDYSLRTAVPVLQLHLHPWQIFQKSERGEKLKTQSVTRSTETHSYTELTRPKSVSSDNYAVLVPAYIVMDNILGELV